MRLCVVLVSVLPLMATCASTGSGRAPVPPASPDGPACERGDAEACAREGRRLSPAAAGAGDLAQAFRLYDRACTLGSDDGCNVLSGMYLEGRGVAMDKAKAVSVVRASCDLGRPGGCAVLGSFLLDGLTGKRDEAAARALCLEGPIRARALWCAFLGVAIDQERASGGPELILQVYRRACSPDIDFGCTQLATALFRFGQRDNGLALGDKLCAGGNKQACADMKQLRAMMAREQRHGGGPPGTLPAPLHLRVPDEGISYDPPGDNWGTGVPTHEGGPKNTVWRWWRPPGTQIEVSLLRWLPPGAAAAGGTAELAAALEGIARSLIATLAEGARVNGERDTLADKPSGHAWFETGTGGRGDIYITTTRGAVCALLVLQNVAFNQQLLERAKAGLHVEAETTGK